MSAHVPARELPEGSLVGRKEGGKSYFKAVLPWGTVPAGWHEPSHPNLPPQCPRGHLAPGGDSFSLGTRLVAAWVFYFHFQPANTWPECLRKVRVMVVHVILSAPCFLLGKIVVF